MTRRLIDYKKLDHHLANLLLETYPHGYGDEDIIHFKNHNGDHVEAVELKTADAIYLVKISKSLSTFIANFEKNMEKELGADATGGTQLVEDPSEDGPVLQDDDVLSVD
ncbi:hypothetical protein [Maribacter sp. 2307ULW6-5]|uniref:hypothetical protein n=1 Tax=Maribacter sp. 2307ULW6-5 TaxID=3386275 RepID=UPI0039BC3590